MQVLLTRCLCWCKVPKCKFREVEEVQVLFDEVLVLVHCEEGLLWCNVLGGAVVHIQVLGLLWCSGHCCLQVCLYIFSAIVELVLVS